MSSDNEFTVHVEGENLNLKIAPGSEEEWKRAVSLVELAAELDGVELRSSEMEGFEGVAEHFENEVGDLRREFDSVQTQLETVMDNFVSDEELDSKLNNIEEMIQEDGSASFDVDEKLSAMWDMIDELEEKVEEVHQVRESDGSGVSESDNEELPEGVGEPEPEEVEDVLERDLKSETMRILSDDHDDQDQEESVESDSGDSDDGFASLSEFREMSVEEREGEVLQVIRERGPIRVNRIGEELFGKEIETNSQEYKEIHNRISNLDDNIEKEQSGRKTLYKVEESQESEPEDTGADDDSDSVEEGEETSDEGSESEVTVDRPDLDSVEWVGIEEAVADYKDDKDLTYLINRESQKSFKSITTPQALAKTSENRNHWAAVRELPEEFQG